MSDFIFSLDIPEKSELPPCRGLFFRYREYKYMTGNGFKWTQEIVLLKKISCKGCDICGCIFDDMSESPDLVEVDAAASHGDVLRASVVVDSTDWETGHVDGWHTHLAVVDSPISKP